MNKTSANFVTLFLAVIGAVSAFISITSFVTGKSKLSDYVMGERSEPVVAAPNVRPVTSSVPKGSGLAVPKVAKNKATKPPMVVKQWELTENTRVPSEEQKEEQKSNHRNAIIGGTLGLVCFALIIILNLIRPK